MKSFWTVYFWAMGIQLVAYIINHRRSLDKKECCIEALVAFIPIINVVMAFVEVVQLLADEYMVYSFRKEKNRHAGQNQA